MNSVHSDGINLFWLFKNCLHFIILAWSHHIFMLAIKFTGMHRSRCSSWWPLFPLLFEIGSDQNLWRWRLRRLRKLNRFFFDSVLGKLHGSLLHLDLVLESADDILALNSIDLRVSVLFQEFIDVHEATADTNFDLVTFFDLDVHLPLTELVHARRFSQEHDLELFSLRELFDVVGKFNINLVVTMTDVEARFF